jgi:hypothetical protein
MYLSDEQLEELALQLTAEIMETVTSAAPDRVKRKAVFEDLVYFGRMVQVSRRMVDADRAPLTVN